MTKMVKKIAAMGAAVMMMASISAMGASAYTDLEKNGAYCTAYKSSSSSVYASTSTKDGNTLNTGSGNSYTRGVSTTCSTPSGGTFKSATITHKLNNATVYTGYLV